MYYVLSHNIIRPKVSKLQIQPEDGEWAGWRGSGWPNLPRETKISGVNRNRKNTFFLFTWPHCRSDNHTYRWSNEEERKKWRQNQGGENKWYTYVLRMIRTVIREEKIEQESTPLLRTLFISLSRMILGSSTQAMIIDRKGKNDLFAQEWSGTPCEIWAMYRVK